MNEPIFVGRLLPIPGSVIHVEELETLVSVVDVRESLAFGYSAKRKFLSVNLERDTWVWADSESLEMAARNFMIPYLRESEILKHSTVVSTEHSGMNLVHAATEERMSKRGKAAVRRALLNLLFVEKKPDIWVLDALRL